MDNDNRGKPDISRKEMVSYLEWVRDEQGVTDAHRKMLNAILALILEAKDE